MGFGIADDTTAKGPGRRAAAQMAKRVGNDPDPAEDNAERDALLKETQARDLIEFGMIPEC